MFFQTPWVKENTFFFSHFHLPQQRYLNIFFVYFFLERTYPQVAYFTMFSPSKHIGFPLPYLPSALLHLIKKLFFFPWEIVNLSNYVQTRWSRPQFASIHLILVSLKNYIFSFLKHIGLRWTRVDQGGLEPNSPRTIKKNQKTNYQDGD